jgi:AraC-like DNA-binding protein
MKRRIDSVFWQSLCLNVAIVLVIAIALGCFGVEMERSSCKKEQERTLEIMTTRLDRLSDQLSNAREYLTVVRAASAVADAESTWATARSYLMGMEERSPLIRRVVITFPEQDILVNREGITKGIAADLTYYNVGNVRDSFFTSAAMTRSEEYLSFEDSPNDAFVYTLAMPSADGLPAMNVAVYIHMEGLMNVLFPRELAPYVRAQLQQNDTQRDNSRRLTTLQGSWYAPDDCYTHHVSSHGIFSMDVEIDNMYFKGRLFIIRNYVWLTFSATLMVGILMAYFASVRQNLPVKKALSELSARGLISNDSRNIFNGLLISVDSLMTEKENAQQQMTLYQAQLRDNMLDRLFASTVPSPGLEENVTMEFENFPRKSVVYYCKALISAADDSTSLEMTAMLLLEYLRKELPENAVIHATDELTFGLVYPMNGSEARTGQELEKLLQEVPKHFSAQVVAVSGGVCDGAAEVGMCFERAQLGYYASSERRAPKQVLLEPDDPLAFDESLQLRPMQTMYQYMASGDSEHAVAALETFFVCPTDVQLIDIRERYCALKVQILLACREIAPNCAVPEIPNFRISDSAEEQLAALTRAVRQVSGYVQQRQSSARDDQFTSLMEYLHANYSDSSLCAASLADEFRVSEKYLFSLFKKQTGYSPISYLHRIRMQEAAKLLTESDLTAQEISERVGFANFGTFHKAFKREYGLAPSKYRESAVRN